MASSACIHHISIESKKAINDYRGDEGPREYCVSDTNNAIGFAAGAMFVRETFAGDAILRTEEMFDAVRMAFIENLAKLQWMKENTRVTAAEKINAITKMIGFPDHILDPHLLDDQYKSLEIDSTKYFDNNVKLNIFHLAKTMKKLDEPVTKTEWDLAPQTVNAFYSRSNNQIEFPAGI